MNIEPSTSRESVPHRFNTNIRMYINEMDVDYPPHWHTDIEIIYPTVGTYKVNCQSRSFLLEPGDILLICPAAIHEIFSTAPGGSRIYVQAYRQMVLYLNGRYWGVYNLREKITSTFIAQHYGLNNPDGVDILMGNGNDKCVIAGDDNVWREYTEMVEWADTHDLSNAANYAYICSMIDEKNLALYTAAEIIVGNTDTGNIKYWRTKETDNKWRWLFYDFCWAMNRNDNNSDATTSGYRRDFFARYFDEKGHGAGKATSTKLIRALFRNATWRQLLLEYSAYLFNEVYTPEKIIARVDQCHAVIEAEMVFDTERWDGITYKTWNQHCENIRDYARNYRPYYLKYAQKFFGLSDREMIAAFGEVSSLN